MPIVNSKPDAELNADLDATVAWAKAQGGDTTRLGIMGFCRGGRTVWIYSAHNPGLKAGVAFYGSLADPENDIWPKNALNLVSQIKERCSAFTAPKIRASSPSRSRTWRRA